jgi:protein arginine N-methyltransferase 1
MSLLACQAGARRVYAIEPSWAVQILVEAARDNGFADRVVVLQRRSTDVTLPERADVIVSDLRGVLPPFGTHFADLIDARNRLLAPGGRVVPTSDTMWAAVVTAPEVHEYQRRAWESRPYGLDLRSALRFVDNEARKHRAHPEDLLSKPVSWATIHYPTLTALGVRGAGTCTVTRADVAHGLLVWFDTTLLEGVGYDNGPDRHSIYGQLFFPWPRAFALAEGDTVAFELRADPVGGDYEWTWQTEIRRGTGEVARFRQSTVNSVAFSREFLLRRTPSFAPALSAAGSAALQALEAVRAGRTVGEIARALHETHPDRFPSIERAQGFLAELLERYGA